MHHVRVTYYTASSGAQTHQHVAFDLLVTPFMLNSKPNPQELHQWSTTIEESLHSSTVEKSEKQERNQDLMLGLVHFHPNSKKTHPKTLSSKTSSSKTEDNFIHDTFIQKLRISCNRMGKSIKNPKSQKKKSK